MLFVVNDDTPGIIGRLGKILGEGQVNIANMAVSRNRKEARALMALSLDSPATEERARDAGRRARVRRGPLHRPPGAVSDWPPEVERVATVLREGRRRVADRVDGRGDGHCRRRRAGAVGCGLAQIVKSLLFSCNDKWVLAMIPGDRIADRVKIAAAAGAQKASTAGPGRRLRGITGYPPGGVAPFPLPGVHAVLMEQTMLSHDVVWIGAGSPRHVAALTPAGPREGVSRAYR